MALEQLITAWGPPAIFAGCFLEGETAAILGGMIVHRGLADWAGIALVAFLGAFLSDQMWFGLSRHAGRWPVLARLLNKARATPLHARMQRSSGLMALSFRFIPGTRIAGPLLLAQTAMAWPRFAALNAMAAVVWAALFTGIGYHFGRAAEGVFGRLPLPHWLMLAAVVVVAALVLHRLIRR